MMDGANVEKVYRKCLKRERDRERKWRKSKRHKDVRNHLHFVQVDFEEAEAQDESPAWLSDRGSGVEAVIRFCDGELGASYYQRRIKFARRRLARFDKRLLEVFDLIMKNGKNREESICQMASKRRPHGRRRRRDTGTTEKKS